MKISINNKEVEAGATLLISLTEELALPARGVAIAVNNRMIPRTDWNKFALIKGDSIVIIQAACGG